MNNVAIMEANSGWNVQVEGNVLHTPRRSTVIVPTAALAEAIAGEWRQRRSFSTAAMPMTAIAFTAIDIVPANQSRMVESMLAFADTDLLLYRSETQALRKRQDAAWNPIVAWIDAEYGHAPEVTEGVMPVTQPEALLQALREALTQFNAFTMAAFSVLTQNLGSLFLALAVKNGRLTPDDAFTYSRIDEDYQAEVWGEDSVTLGRAREIKRDVLAAARFLDALQ